MVFSRSPLTAAAAAARERENNGAFYRLQRVPVSIHSGASSTQAMNE